MHIKTTPSLEDWTTHINEKYDWSSSLRMPDEITPALIEIVMRTAGLIRYKKEEV